MMRRFGFLFATLVGVVFAKDVYQPVKRGALELGAGYSYAQFMGIYDADGNLDRWSELGLSGYEPAAYGIPFRAKYGLGDGIDLKADWDAVFSNKDAGDLQGMGQPKLGIKYAMSLGGGFSNLTLPVAMGDLADLNLRTSFEVGGFVRKKLTHFRFIGLLSYTNVFAGSDVVRLSAQPEVLWNKKTSTYLSLEYLKAANKDAYLLLMTPGIRADISKAAAFETAFGITVAGRNSPSVWTLKMSLLWTLLR